MFYYFQQFNLFFPSTFSFLLFSKTYELQFLSSIITLFAIYIGCVYERVSPNNLIVFKRLAIEYRALFLLLVLFINLMLFSTNLFSFFMCLEATGFIVILMCAFGSKTIPKIEASIKYFIITAVSSCFVLFSIAGFYLFCGSVEYVVIHVFFGFAKVRFFYYLPALLFICGLVLKLGLFPGYAWVGDVAEGVTWPSFLLINILLKLSLLVFIKEFFIDIYMLDNIFIFIGFLSFLLGIFITIMQTKFNRFLACSSVSHVGFAVIFLSMDDAKYFSLLYLICYFTALCKLVYMLNETILSFNRLVYFTDFSFLIDSKIKTNFTFAILNLGGFPPYDLFLVKLILFFFLIKNNFFIVLLTILCISLYATFYYLRLLKNLYYDLNSPFMFLYGSVNDVVYASLEVFLVATLYSPMSALQFTFSFIFLVELVYNMY